FPAANNSLTAILWKCARGGACGPVRAASAYWIGLASGSPPMQKVAPRQLSHGSLVSTLLVAALCGTFSLAAMAAPEVWLEDLRRCMIYLPIERGRIAIAYDEAILEIDVQRGDGVRERAATAYIVTFDDRPPIETKPPETGAILDHVL